MMKMADYSMEDDAWNKRALKVRTYLENNDLGDMEQVILWNLNQGQNDAVNRKRYWTSITTLFGMLPDSPISRGRESDLPEEVSQAIAKIAANYAEAFSAPFATDPLFGEIVRKHGKSGYGVYADVGEYSDSLKSSMKSALTTYYRNHLKGRDGPQWDGSINNGTVVITVQSSEVSEEEE
jgi:hypothetical protein